MAVSYTFGYNSGYNNSENDSNKNELDDFPDISTLKQFLARAGYRAQVVVKSDYLSSDVSHARVQFWVESINVWVLVEPQSDGIIGIYTSCTKYGSWIGEITHKSCEPMLNILIQLMFINC